MDNVSKAIYDWLAADGVLTALLAVYPDPVGGNRPAIFTGEIPGAALLPYLHIRPNLSDIPGTFATKTTRGRSVLRDIECMAENTGSDVPIDTIATRVRDRLDRASFAIPGASAALIVSASGPIEAPTDRHFSGRIVTVTMEYAL